MAKLIKTRPGKVENTLRTQRMKRPMRCWSCRTTKEFIWIVRFKRMLCLQCLEKKSETANEEER